MSPVDPAIRTPACDDGGWKRPAPPAISKSKVSTLTITSTCPVFLAICTRAIHFVDGFILFSFFFLCVGGKATGGERCTSTLSKKRYSRFAAGRIEGRTYLRRSGSL